MSQESAKAVIDKMKTDEEFRNKIMEVEGVDQRIKLINDEGFEVTRADLGSESNRLTGEELELVAGGKWDTCCRGQVHLNRLT